MKRLGTLLLTIAIVAGLSGTVAYLWNASVTPQKGYAFDLIVKGTNVDFWKSVNEGAQAAASTYNCTVTMVGPAIEKNYSQQVGLMEGSIARRPNAIILAAADYNLLAEPVQKAYNAGIPVVMVDSDVNSPHTVAYVGTDNRQLGTMLAQQVCKNLKGVSGEVGIVSFVKESDPALQREEGFRNAMRSVPGLTMLETEYGESDVAKTECLTADMVARHPNLVAVASLNAQASQGAAQALSKLGRKDIQLFAIDCTPEEAMYMEEGVLKVALLQNPYQMGYYGVETAYRYLKGEKVGKRNTDIYLVDLNNLFDDKYQQLIFPFNS